MPEYPGGQAAFDQDLKLAMKQTKEAKEKLFVKFTRKINPVLLKIRLLLKKVVVLIVKRLF